LFKKFGHSSAILESMSLANAIVYRRNKTESYGVIM